MFGSSLFQKLQILEFSSLTASGAGAIGANIPIMCNGANLAYKKKIFYRVGEQLNYDILSGDDMFMLHTAKKLKAEIRFLKTPEIQVKTRAEINFEAFVNQRTRWGSKTKSYNDYITILVAVIVTLANLVILVSFLAIALGNWNFSITMNLTKLTVDFVLIFIVNRYYKSIRSLRLFPVLHFIYPVYIILIASLSILGGNNKWK